MTNDKKEFHISVEATLRWDKIITINADSKGEASSILFNDILYESMVREGDLDTKVRFIELNSKVAQNGE